jgi:hypothetical protein
MTEKAKKVGRKSLATKRQELLIQLWGDELDDLAVWSRHEHDGFSTIPRTLPHITRILDALADAGSPLGQTYLALWCRVFDEGLVEIKDQAVVAYESGFGGKRMVSTWTSRMKKLRDLGFISTKKTFRGEFQYVLLLNPFVTIKKIYEDKPQDERYIALVERMLEVGAKWE